MFKNKVKLKYGLHVVALFLAVIIFASILQTMTFAVDVASPSDRVIVSLGDSYSSGEGIEPFYGQNLPIDEKVKNLNWIAHRSQKAWGGMLTLPSVDGTMSENCDNWFFVAASGATTANIDGTFTKQYYKKQGSLELSGEITLPPQLNVFKDLERLKKEADYVTLTIGGNDVGFPDIVETAVKSSLYTEPASLTDKINNAWKKFYEGGIREDIGETYEKIHDAAGDQAHILVVGYPELVDSNGNIFFSKQNANALNIATNQFNDALTSIVYNYRDSYGYNISFVPVQKAFEGHAAYSDDPYINGISINVQGLPSEDINDHKLVSAYSIHPNEKGARVYAECVQAKIDELEGIVSESSNTQYNTNLKLSVYDVNNDYYDDYTVDITGTYKTGWFGLFEKDYNDHFVVKDSKPQSVILNPNGKYNITVTDNNDNTKVYSKDIEVSEDYVNKRLSFVTDFGKALDVAGDGDHEDAVFPTDAVEFNGHHYYVYDLDTVTTWEEAKEYCESQGGYLATITSKEENDFLYSYITDMGYDSVLFGLSDTDQDDVWTWVTDELFSYENWASGEPNNQGGSEHYGMYFEQNTDGTWNDGSGETGPFLCEWGEYQTDPNSQPEEPVTTTSDERDIVLVLDSSASMDGTPMEETQKAATKFINTILKEDASIGVVTYADNADKLSDFSIDKNHLTEMVADISSGGNTNMESGLAEAKSMLDKSSAKKKIIVLMSDGEPNNGKEGEELISYADEIKSDDIWIYTLGFFENMNQNKSSAQNLMEHLASEGCHYEVSSADDLVFFFEDIADQINGQKYIYIRIACPVDVTVTYDGETLSSAEDDLNDRTDFGTLTFEDNEDVTDEDDRIKILRLKEGTDYDVQIAGTGRGLMDYTIGFMDESGYYDDFRRFENVKITKQTIIDTVAAVSDESVLNIDADGDGRYDMKLRAKENGYGEEVKRTIWIYVGVCGGVILLMVALVIVICKKKKKKD